MVSPWPPANLSRSFLKQPESVRPSSTFIPHAFCSSIDLLMQLRTAPRYDPFIFAGFTFNRDGKVPPSHELSTASDSVLTALAQLGAYQTGTDRAFVSFFDPSHQYIVAEATPSMRIAPNLPSEGCPEPLSLCGTAIPRQQGTCDHVLFMSSPSDAADAAELPLSFVPNLATDSRFSSRPYCQFGDTGQFYASVPVRTARGVNIGAYCVMSSTQPKSWDDQSTQHLRDISLAIADHLELKRSKFEARNHARVNRGLGSLIAGKGTLTGWQFAANAEAFQNDAASEGALNVAQQHSESQEEHRKPEEERLANLEDEDSANQQETAKHRAPSPPPSNMQRISVSDDDGSGLIFSKAANIIREAFEVEGSVFLDVAVGSYKRPLSSPTEEIPNSNKTPSLASMSSSSDEQTHTSSARMPDDGSCDLLGFSTTDASSVDVSTPMDGNRIVMPKRFLAKLLRRYPNGRIFNFDAIGELETSDSSGDDDVVVASSGSVGSSQITVDKPRQPLDSTRGVQHGKRYGRSQEGTLIHQAFPGARSVAFIPVWDPKRERWFAGGFMYTLHPTRVFSADNELAFLGAFAKLIAAEVLNSETLKADKAKSDILGSLSHELRSPLHGVILSTDLLNDTDLSVFQGNAIHTIETCGRTLLDTIEHLLDYSKINSFAATETSAISNPRGQRKRNKSDFFGKKSLFSHTRLDALVEDVVESVFAGFNFQYMSIRQMVKKHKTGHADTAAHRRLDAELAMEQLGSSLNDEHEKRVVFGNTSVYITIDPTCDWTFYIQPGALRRIVMNLLGNSLKYTTCGTIRVSLGQQQAGRSSAERFVTLTVHDTGRGMSEDYLRHKLFRPFSQEDELMPGTGLGLSLVKRITSQLHGQISVESQLGVGTTIAVTLPLEPTSPKSKSMRELVDDDTDFKNQVCQLTNLRVRLQGFGPEWGRDGRLLVEDICHRWLHLDLVSDLDKAPEIILWSEDALPTSFGDMGQLARVPNVVVCRDALAAYRLWTRHEHVGRTRVFEYISQP